MARRSPILTACLAVALAALAAGASAQVVLKDIGTNWAREAIESLVSRGIIRGYPDGTFRPDRPITRAELARILTDAFAVEPVREAAFNDIARHWAEEPILELAQAGVVEGYPDGSFRPESEVTRAEAVSMIVRLLKLHDVRGFAETGSFHDVPSSHWAHDSIEVALRLKLLPPYLRGTFEPSRPASRAEVAAMVAEARRLRVVKGTIDYLEPETRVVGVTSGEGVRDFTLGAGTVIHRNTTVAPFENLVLGDAVYVVSDRFGTPQFVKANGAVTGNDVAAKVTHITRGLLTPNDLRAIIAGDWDALAASLKSTLYDELVKRGATPMEASAIMTQDWDSLQVYAKDRLAQVIGAQLGITTDLARALLDRDWKRAKELAQVEAVEQLLGQLLIEPPSGA